MIVYCHDFFWNFDNFDWKLRDIVIKKICKTLNPVNPSRIHPHGQDNMLREVIDRK